MIAFLGVPAFLLTVNENGDVVYSACNQEWFEETELTADEVLGKTAKEIYGGDLGDECYQRHLQAASVGEKISYDLMLPMSGRLCSVNTRLTPIKDEKAVVSHVLGASINRTSQFEAMTALNNMETVASEIEEFISMAAHDLRTPMNNVKTMVDMLRHDFQDMGDGKLELINMLERVAVKATTLINDVLSHAQATTAIKRLEEFELSQLCSDIMVVIDPTNQHFLNASHSRIAADKTATQIVLRNLMDNAIKHSGKSMVDLSVKVQEEREGMLSFVVNDNGQGFPDPTVAFLDGGEMQADAGFGLLGIRRLVTARGGDISAENVADGEGSQVRFTLSGNIVHSLH